MILYDIIIYYTMRYCVIRYGTLLYQVLCYTYDMVSYGGMRYDSMYDAIGYYISYVIWYGTADQLYPSISYILEGMVGVVLY